MRARLRLILVKLLCRLLVDDGDIVGFDGRGRAWVPLDPNQFLKKPT